jgi:hypothetical protein
MDSQSSARRRNDCARQIVIEHAITADMDNGRPLPPLIVDGVVWRVVRRLPGGRT